MDFKINPLSFTGIFPVPNSLVDENIRLASVVQLKTVLYLLRHGNENDVTTKKIAEALMLPEEDITDALIFWQERGLVIKEGQTPDLASMPTVNEPVTTVKLQKAEIKKAEVTPAENTKKVVPNLDIPRPSHEQVAARLKECEELSTLFQEAQTILGKTIGYEGQAVLIMMHDGYGLPVEVILMALEYAVIQKKTGFSHIAKIGKIWCENEIDSIEAVSEYIQEHSIVNETWDKLRSMTEITNRNPTEKQRRFLTVWVKEFGYDENIIFYAYEESIDHTGKMSMPYMDKIIRNWHAAGVKTPSDIEKLQKDWDDKKKRSTGKNKDIPSSEPSYDMEAYMKQAVNIKYIKSENN